MAGAAAITFVGNLTNDVEMRFTNGGMAVASFTVAVSERVYDKQAQEWKEGDTTFIRCSVWRQYAENVAETLTKGMRVIVTGTLKVRQYETKDGAKGTSVECSVDEVGPSLAWATADVRRVSRTDSGSGRKPVERSSSGWGNSSADDEAPF
jgi:single-strand DNA-binding protein